MTKKQEKPIVIAYQGEPGSYSEQAILLFFAKHHPSSTTSPDPTYMPCTTFNDAFTALSNGVATRAAIPIENCLAGTIHENYDHLLRHSHLSIVGEIDVPIRHCLQALPGTKLEDIHTVRSHAIALAQCTKYIQSHNLISEVVYDTAGYAKQIHTQQLRNVAAIASSRAAEIYDLDIVDSKIQDEPINFTRFLILSNTRIHPDCNYYQNCTDTIKAKTSIAFSLLNSPGILCRALSVFAVCNIDLSKIESRHLHTVRKSLGGQLDIDFNAKRWGYVFYVDFLRHADEDSVKAALNHLQQITSFYRLLGSYPADSTIADSQESHPPPTSTA